MQYKTVVKIVSRAAALYEEHGQVRGRSALCVTVALREMGAKGTSDEFMTAASNAVVYVKDGMDIHSAIKKGFHR